MHGRIHRCSSQARTDKKKKSLSPGNNKEHAADACAGQQHVHPDVRRQGVQEGEDARIGAVGFAVQDADTQSHEGFGEVYDFLSDIGDGQGSHGEVRHLETKIKQTESALQAQEKVIVASENIIRKNSMKYIMEEICRLVLQVSNEN